MLACTGVQRVPARQAADARLVFRFAIFENEHAGGTSAGMLYVVTTSKRT
jgi:hypothetical protein